MRKAMQMFCMFTLSFWHLSLINTCMRIPTCMRCPQDLHTPCNAHTRYRSHHVQQSQSRAKTRCQPCQPVLNRIMAHCPLGICPSSQEPDSVMSLSPLVSAIEPSESSKSSTSIRKTGKILRWLKCHLMWLIAVISFLNMA